MSIGDILIPGPLRPLPLPPGVSEALAEGSEPVRVTFTATVSLRVIRGGPGKVAGLMIQAGAADAVAYLVDTVEDTLAHGDAAAVEKRKAPASAAANRMDGWWCPSRDLAPTLKKGIAVSSSQADAEVFVYIV